MTKGLLEGKLIPTDFWPACSNCRHFEECKVSSRHRAFPHTWHWGKEVVQFTEGMLVLTSWVGTVAIGEKHTGCYDYQVDTGCLLHQETKHRRYLELQDEFRMLNEQLDRFEARGVYNEEVAKLYDRLNQVMTEQDMLTQEG